MSRLLFVIMILLIVAIPAFAQDENIIASCDQAYMADTYNALEGVLSAAKVAMDNNDIEAWRLAIRSIRTVTEVNDSYCSGLSFNNEKDGQQAVIGPFTFIDGKYRVTAQTEGFMMVDLESLEGTCETSGLGGMFNLWEGQATTGAQTLLTTEGCMAMILVSNTHEPWTLNFELLYTPQ